MIIISSKKRVNLLTTYFVDHEYVNTKDIETEFTISKRSAFYWIKDMNFRLDQMSLDNVQRLTQSKYCLPTDTKKALMHYDNLQQNDYPVAYSNKYSRHDIILWSLIQNKQGITLNNMSNYFHVSKNTIINDFQDLKADLPKAFSVKNTRNGKQLIGNELIQRSWVYQIVCANENQMILKEMRGAHYRYLQDELNLLQRKGKVVFSDNSFETLATFLSWCLKRIQLNQDRFVENVPEYLNFDDVVLKEWVESLMNHFNIPIKDTEVSYFKNIIYSAQTKNIPNWQCNSELPVDKLVDEIIKRFTQISGTNVDSEQLRNGLKAHLLSTYQRLVLNIPYKSPNLKEIKNDYSELMDLTSFAVQPFENYVHKNLSEDELTLITTYFGGQSNRIKNNQSFSTNIDVLLLCSSGVGTSYFLQQTLKRKYNRIKFSRPLGIKEFKKFSNIINAKLVISTVELENKQGMQAVTVHGIPTEKDFELIDKALHQVGLTAMHDANKLARDVMDIISNEVMINNPESLNKKLVAYFKDQVDPGSITTEDKNDKTPSIKELLPQENVSTTKKELSWKQAIQKAFIPLLKNDSVSASYVTEIINKLQEKGPFMLVKEGVLLAHSSPSSKVYKIGMSLLKLDNPATIENEKIDVIICLAPKKEKQHLRALSGLLEILQDNRKYTRLVNAKNKQDLVTLIDDLKN